MPAKGKNTNSSISVKGTRGREEWAYLRRWNKYGAREWGKGDLGKNISPGDTADIA